MFNRAFQLVDIDIRKCRVGAFGAQRLASLLSRPTSIQSLFLFQVLSDIIDLK
jgi:hypothetical protein